MLIAKVERQQALENIDEIAAAADGLMVARGDLGLETSPEAIPGAQRDIIAAARRHKKPVIVATQMMETMISNPMPSRAEASDVAAAVFDAADAVMLSGETAAAARGPLIVEMQQKVLKATERDNRLWALNRLRAPDATQIFAAAASLGGPLQTGGPQGMWGGPPRAGVSEAVARGAVAIANDLGARALLCHTKSGRGPALLSALRPQTPIVAVCSDLQVARKLQLYFGVHPILQGAPKDGPSGGLQQPGGPAGAPWLRAAKAEAQQQGFTKDATDLLVAVGPEGEGGPLDPAAADKGAPEEGPSLSLRVVPAGTD